jgi:hypothetical protein
MRYWLRVSSVRGSASPQSYPLVADPRYTALIVSAQMWDGDAARETLNKGNDAAEERLKSSVSRGPESTARSYSVYP